METPFFILKYPIKNEVARVATTFHPLYVYVYFLKSRRAANSAIHGGIRPNPKLIRDFIAVLFTCKNEERPNQKMKALEWPQHSSLTLWEVSVAMETRVVIRSDSNFYAAFPQTQMMLQIKFDCDRPAGIRDIHVRKCEHTD